MGGVAGGGPPGVGGSGVGVSGVRDLGPKRWRERGGRAARLGWNRKFGKVRKRAATRLEKEPRLA
jgi:hypothetical protein